VAYPMSRKHLFLFIALGGLLICSRALAGEKNPPTNAPNAAGISKESASPQGKSDRNSSQQNNHSKDSADERDIPRPTVIQNFYGAQGPESKSGATEQRENDDLKAQQRMADAAEGLESLTLWQLWIGIIGGVLLFGTLIYARATVVVADKTAKRQLRAYLGTTCTGYDAPVAGKAFRPLIVVENYGQTPATHFKYGSESMIIKKGDVGPEWTKPASMLTGPPMFPRQIKKIPDVIVDPITKVEVIMSDELIREVERGDSIIYVWGLVTYTDAFQQQHWTKFRYKITGEPFLKQKAQACEEGNEIDEEQKSSWFRRFHA